MRRISLILLIALALVLLLAPAALADFRSRTTVGRATIFGTPGDRHAGGNAKCLGRKINATDVGVATRKGRCGQRYLVTNKRTGISVVATKVDAGPYGACLDDGWTRGKCQHWAIKRRKSDPGVWRGIADLTPTLATALAHRSFDQVILTTLPPISSPVPPRPGVRVREPIVVSFGWNHGGPLLWVRAEPLARA